MGFRIIELPCKNQRPARRFGSCPVSGRHDKRPVVLIADSGSRQEVWPQSNRPYRPFSVFRMRAISSSHVVQAARYLDKVDHNFGSVFVGKDWPPVLTPDVPPVGLHHGVLDRLTTAPEVGFGLDIIGKIDIYARR